MRRYSRKQRIHASAQQVWSILVDFERWPEWTASVSGIEVLDCHPPGVGSRVRIRQPKLPPAVWAITVWEPERCFVWESASAGFRIIASHIVEPCGEGCEVAFDLSFVGLFSGLAGLFYSRLTQRYMNLEAEGLRSRSEGLLRDRTGEPMREAAGVTRDDESPDAG